MNEPVHRFLIEESRLLDAGDWESWLALFSQDGVYWMPAAPLQKDPVAHVSLIFDDAALRHLRCRRFLDRGEGGALSLQPFPRSLRFLSNIEVLDAAPQQSVTAHANLIVAQYAHSAVDTFHARVTWNLLAHEGRLLIQQKRVDLLNCDGPLSDILVYF
jgi:benzoate/toluate 1,2-dioxygenase beta subunit